MKAKSGIIWLWKVAKPYRLSLLVNSGAGVLRVCVSLGFVWVCKHLIDVAVGQTDGALWGWAALMVLCPVLQLSLSIVNVRVENWSEISLRNDLLSRLFSHLLESAWCGKNAPHSGDMMNRLTADVATVSNALCRDVPYIVITSAQLLGALVFFFWLDARLAAILLLVMPIALFASKLYLKRMRQLTTELRSQESSIQSCVQENLQNRTLVQTMEFSRYVSNRLHALQSVLGGLVMRRTNLSLFSGIAVQAGFSCGYAIAFLWGVWGLRSGAVTFGMMTAFIQLVAQVQRPTVELSRQIPAFARTLTAVERLLELLGLPKEEKAIGTPLHVPVGVRMEQVCYAYPDSETSVFSGFSYDFAPGSFTAIVGETGSGKSTLFRLILALIEPKLGRVLFYDAEHTCVASPSTRCHLSYVPQGNSLISGTIRENLLMGNPCASDTELRQALSAAVADFVWELPQGIDSYCGEQGVGLSEGQAQRIAIARGLLRPGCVLLLDEPTSALDAHTGQRLLERLAELSPDKTIILITHNEHVADFCRCRIDLNK